MSAHYGFNNLPNIQRPVVTIGSFDGVHIGHRALLDTVCHEADKIDGTSVVVTFSPHPREVLPRGGADFRLLTTLERRLELLAQAGIEEVVVAKFDMEFAALTSEEFVRDFLVSKLRMATLVVGYNHRFGHDRNIEPNHFELLGEKYGFKVVRAEPFTLNGNKISSSVIRNLLAEGKTDKAEQLLGYKL